MKVAIQSVIKELMDRVLDNVSSNPFLEDVHRAQRPLYAALVPDEIFKGSHFERRFVTPFGKVWERLAVVAAENGLGFGRQDYSITGAVKEGRLQRIAGALYAVGPPGEGKHPWEPP